MQICCRSRVARSVELGWLWILLLPPLVLTACKSTGSLYPKLAQVQSIALVTMTGGVKRINVPLRSKEFVEFFSERLVTRLDQSTRLSMLTLPDVIKNPAYQALDMPVPVDQASPPGLKDLSAADKRTIQDTREQLVVDALLLVSTEYSIHELYYVSGEYRLRVHTQARLVVDDFETPIWSTEFDDDRELDLRLLAVQLAAFVPPTKGQWERILDSEAVVMAERATRIAEILAQEIESGFAIATGEEQPGLWRLARSSDFRAFGQWAQAWASIKLLLITLVVAFFFGVLHNNIDDDSELGKALALPGLASNIAWMVALYYIFRAIL